MDTLSVFGPTVVTGVVSLSGIALKVRFDGRDRRRRGHRDIEAAQTQLAFCREWLAVRDSLDRENDRPPIPATLRRDLVAAYDRATTGNDLLAEEASNGVWTRVARSVFPARGLSSSWAKVWRAVYWCWFAVAFLLALAIIGTVGESSYDPEHGVVYNFTMSVTVGVIVFGLFCVAPLAVLRHLTHRSEVRQAA